MSDDDDADRRRQQEINMFAAFASGNFEVGDTFTAKGVEKKDEKDSEEKEEKMSPLDDANAAFASAVAAVSDSGTFATASTKKPSSAASSNLEAAAAALSGSAPAQETPKLSTGTQSPGTNILNPVPSKPRTSSTSHKDRYVEKVLLPRPLFFGAVLPPRVVREARRVLQSSQHENGVDSTAPEHRNLLGAVQAFGFGISPLSQNGTDNDYRGTPYLSTYQPVWGDLARIDREERRNQRRENKASNEEKKNDSSGIKEEEKEVNQVAGASSSEQQEDATPIHKPAARKPLAEEETPLIKNTSAERKLFSQWAQGDDGADAVTSTSPPAAPVAEPSEKDLFSKWALGGEEALSSSGTFSSITSKPINPVTQSSPMAAPLGSPEPMSDKQLFSQWARGGEDDQLRGNESFSNGEGLFRGSNSPLLPGITPFSSDTFRPVEKSSEEGSGSFVGSEVMKKVGMNDNLNAALVSLSEGQSSSASVEDPGSLTAENSLLAGLCPTTEYGRPLSNLELTNGCAPMYSCDDSPLPYEMDLGMFETREDQIRSNERRRAAEIIETQVAPNIFGPIACPQPTTGGDGSQSWTSRSDVLAQKVIQGTMPEPPNSSNHPFPPSGHLRNQSTPLGIPASARGLTPPAPPVLPGRSPTDKGGGIMPHPKSPAPRATDFVLHSPGSPNRISPVRGNFDSYTRIGWWNIVDKWDQEGSVSPENSSDEKTPLQLPPLQHVTSPYIQTGLSPSPEKLQEENMPQSFLHCATRQAQALPFLSDRPPSYRYVQIDTRSVAFSGLSGEIEPLFCSMTIYHVEANPMSAPPNQPGPPIPNLQRCGRITEALCFDYVADPDIEARCYGSLWAYAKESLEDVPPKRGSPILGKRGSIRETESAIINNMAESSKAQGTRCGVFPLPSNWNLANLFAVIMVHKVFTTDDAEVDVYMQNRTDTSRNTPLRNSAVDLTKFRHKAEKASDRVGHALMPFAFGVAPLIQIMGTEIPVIPHSKEVQVPLLRFVPGQGERPIYDHIMVMLHPRSASKSPDAQFAEPTKGGVATLIMRNYGYLGLHSAINSRSSLAKERLVDFTGELQVRRRNKDEDKNIGGSNHLKLLGDIGDAYVAPPWHDMYVSEPIQNGGRDPVQPTFKRGQKNTPTNVVRKRLEGASSPPHDLPPMLVSSYVQELAPIPLSETRTFSRSSKSTRGGFSSDPNADSEPYSHYSFCNELLCYPRLLHNCSRKNVIVKVEAREIEWSKDLNAYLAYIPNDGPCVHNHRRGACLIQGAYTSCASKSMDPYFMEEFKVKLPLILEGASAEEFSSMREFSLLFSVFNVIPKEKKSWISSKGSKAKSLFKRKQVQSSEDDARSVAKEEGTTSRMELLGCGFLPITQDSHSLSLISNGLYDIKLKYLAVAAPRSPDSQQVPADDDTTLDKQGISSPRNKTSVFQSDTLLLKAMDSSEDIEEDQKRSRASFGTKSESGYSSSGKAGNDREDAIGTTEELGSGGDMITDLMGELSTDQGEHRLPEMLMEDDESHSFAPEQSMSSSDHLSSVEQQEFHESMPSDAMSLQVRVVVHSSVHPQSDTLCEFLLRPPPQPRCLTSKEISSPAGPWSLDRKALQSQISSGDPSAFDGPEHQDAVEQTIALTKPSLCSHADVSTYFVRVFGHLWRTLVIGNGEPSLEWANPASLISLRLHTFASLVQILNISSDFLGKNGVTRLDGEKKWDLGILGLITGLLFDESELSRASQGSFEECVKVDDYLVTDVTSEKDSVGPSSSLHPNSSSRMQEEVTISGERNHRHRRAPRPPLDGAGLSLESWKLEKDGLPSQPESGSFHKNKNAMTLPPVSDLKALLGQSPGLTPELSENPAQSPDDKSDSTTVASTDSSSSSPEMMNDTAKPGAGDFKIDSKSDFMSALNASTVLDDSFVSQSSKGRSPGMSGSQAAMNMVNAFGSMASNNGPAGNRRRWMTAPSSALATIREDLSSAEGDESKGDVLTDDMTSKISSRTEQNAAAGRLENKGRDALDTETLLEASSKSGVKQMRVPKLRKQQENHGKVEEPVLAQPQQDPAPKRCSPVTVPATDKEIESAGTAFLDVIGKNLGYGVNTANLGGEEKRVGFAHHRKTRSRCSIDWTLPPADLLMENHQQLEYITRQNGDSDSKQSELLKSRQDSAAESTSQGEAGVSLLLSESQTPVSSSPGQFNERGKIDDQPLLRMPNFLDRLPGMRLASGRGRWFPYAYEVLIFQWVACLVEQRRTGEKKQSMKKREKVSTETRAGADCTATATLTDAAMRARGVAISCAPVLFEIIKKSLGARIISLFEGRAREDKDFRMPRVILDDALKSNLEQLVVIVTDACIDSRNFDNIQFRQTSIDVNDAIIRFLRDLFAFLDTETVHRLLMVYFSRFGLKEGKDWQDRASKYGVKSSWEICKLRLNAVTLLLRFPDFVKVNAPAIETWGNWPLGAPASSTRTFFDKALSFLETLEMGAFATAAEGPMARSTIDIPKMKSHWLAELVTDICLSATDHADLNTQKRAASLLHELFWMHSQEGKVNGSLSIVASMYVPFIVKVLGHAAYLSVLPPKSQLPKDIMPCVVFVLQSAPVGLLRSLWRKLCRRFEGLGLDERYGGVSVASVSMFSDASLKDSNYGNSYGDSEDGNEASILNVFSLLNLILKTFEYEGSDESVEVDVIGDVSDNLMLWRNEYLTSQEVEDHASMPSTSYSQENADHEQVIRYSTSSSRKWHSHDTSIVVINTCRHIVREMLVMMRPSAEKESLGTSLDMNLHVTRKLSDSFFEKASSRDGSHGAPDRQRKTSRRVRDSRDSMNKMNFSFEDTVVFVRATVSVYLTALSLRQSDIVVVKTMIAAVEIVKIFGVKVFLAAVAETLQHWMRVVLLYCGARRAEVRVQALEFLALILRLTWDGYGSFSKIRLPLLAVQTEVMERIVATAAIRYNREQRRLGIAVQYLSNDSAEATLAPLWRTLDRLHHQSASKNVAFRSALVRLAQKLKKLYRAYIAAHALSIVNRAQSPLSPCNSTVDEDAIPGLSALLQSRRVSVHRMVKASGGFSKQFLGLHASASQHDAVAHNEAVEDAFLAAADVFSPTELPSHRVAWLRKLAEFHQSRKRHAEEAMCRFQIHNTMRQASLLHDTLWNSGPFHPWASDLSDGVHPDGEGPAGEPVEYYDSDFVDEFSKDESYDAVGSASGKQIDKTNSVRRIFFRNANSVRMRTGDCWDTGGNKFLFFGVALPSEFSVVAPWLTLRQMEEEMVDEAETAGELFLKAGVVESSRFAWSLATKFYADSFNYGRLAFVYQKLSYVVASQIPAVDTSHQVELSSPLGRFYRVYFHGGAPDELIGEEFVYRAAANVKLETFGKQLCDVLKSILPEKTPIDLRLDDGRPEEHKTRRGHQKWPVGGVPLEAVKIKVTPLRPLLVNEQNIRGTPLWFLRRTENPNISKEAPVLPPGTSGPAPKRSSWVADGIGIGGISGRGPGHRLTDSRSFSTASAMTNSSSTYGYVSQSPSTGQGLDLVSQTPFASGGALIGVDKFSFTQSIRKDRMRGSRDVLRTTSGDFASKCLRVTQLQVEQCFPGCVARQSVVHRAVSTQSPLEAGVEAVCTWCAVLFRTAVATNGLSVLRKSNGQGIGSAAAKVVADCIHGSRVKEMGQALLRRNANLAEEDEYGAVITSYTKLSEEAMNKNQAQLARAIILFMELLHLLIARNRDLLLAVVEMRKKVPNAMSYGSFTRTTTDRTRDEYSGQQGYVSNMSSPESVGQSHSRHPSSKSMYSSSVNESSYEGVFANSRVYDDGSTDGPASVTASTTASVFANDRTDRAIAVQSELQRSFILMAKTLYPLVSGTVGSETPGWLKKCCQDNYFKAKLYKDTKLSMEDELFFFAGNEVEFQEQVQPIPDMNASYSLPLSIDPGDHMAIRSSDSPSGSHCGSSVVSDRIQPHSRSPSQTRSASHKPSASHSSLGFI